MAVHDEAAGSVVTGARAPGLSFNGAGVASAVVRLLTRPVARAASPTTAYSETRRHAQSAERQP